MKLSGWNLSSFETFEVESKNEGVVGEVIKRMIKAFVGERLDWIINGGTWHHVEKSNYLSLLNAGKGLITT